MGNLRKPLIVFLLLLPVMTILGAYFKITNSTMSSFFLDATMSFYGIFIVLCLMDIYRSKSLNANEKWMYAIAVIFLLWIGGLLYLLRSEKTKSMNKV